jgi:hypothetical protein
VSATLPSVAQSNSAVNRTLAGFRFVQIRQGDTLHSIAARELSDTTKWSDLIAINGLSYPYITGDPSQASDTVKLYGDLLIVPAAVAQVQASADPAAVYGADLLLQNGQLVAENGDFATVSGLPNLMQALYNRLGTRLRELLFHLDYGNGVFGLIGKAGGPAGTLLAAQLVKASLLQEARLASVNSVTCTDVGDELQVQANVSPIASAAVNLSTSV